MKVMIRKDPEGVLTAYVPKKDLEEPVVGMEREGMWGGAVTLANGWRFRLPEMETPPDLPITVEARRIREDEA